MPTVPAGTNHRLFNSTVSWLLRFPFDQKLLSSIQERSFQFIAGFGTRHLIGGERERAGHVWSRNKFSGNYVLLL